jgi:hypothetical protein
MRFRPGPAHGTPAAGRRASASDRRGGRAHRIAPSTAALFDSREDAVRSHERVVGTVRGELGETMVLATA